MPATKRLAGRCALLLAMALPATSCKSGLFQFHGTVTTTKTVNGKTETKTQEFDNWEEMKVAMDASFKELGATTKELVEKLVEAPPPGRVGLSDLSPNLEPWSGDPRLDFLAAHRAEDPKAFMYVQIGVPTYDAFFRAAGEFHAFVYQTRESIKALRAMAQARVSGRVDAKLSLGDLVEMAMGTEGVEAGYGAQDDLSAMHDLTLEIAGAAPEFARRTQELVATGQQLVTAAPSSITNPKTALHIDLIVKGLGQSVTVIGESGKLLGEMVKDLGTLRR